MPGKQFSTEEALRFGWETFKANPWFFTGLVLLFILLGMAPNMVAGQMGQTAAAAAVSLTGAFLSVLVNMGVIYIALGFVDGKQRSLGDLFTPYKLFFTFFTAGLLYSLIVGIGLVLFIVPGIILGLMFLFYTYRIIDQEVAFTGMIDAFTYSKDITKGAKGRLFLFLLAVTLLNFIGTLPFGLGLFITLPITWVATAHAYRQLEEE